jgi:hypothetical protein
MKYFKALLFVFCVTFVHAQSTPQKYYVSPANQVNELNITTADLNILAKEYAVATDFSDLLVQQVGDHYVLLAKDIAQKWIFAFELVNIDSKLYIDIDKHVNACKSETLSMGVFTVKEGEIEGCVKFDLHVLGRN